MATIMIAGDLFGQLCSFMSTGAQKLVQYVCKLARATYHFISRKVSESLSRLRNIWTLLKGSLSSAMNYIKEKSLQGIKFMMKLVLLLFKWLIDELATLFAGFKTVPKSESNAGFKDVPKSGAESESKAGFKVVSRSGESEAKEGYDNLPKSGSKSTADAAMTLINKTTILMQETLLPGLQNMVQKRGVVVSPIASFQTDLTKLCEKQRNKTDRNEVVDISEAFTGFFVPALGLIGRFLEEVCANIDEDEKAQAKNK